MMRVGLCVASVFVAVGLVGCGGAVDDDALGDETDSVSAPLVSDVSLYSDAALAAPWTSWSWSATVSAANTDAPLASGSKSQIKVALTKDWGALSFARPTGDLALGDYDSVSFSVRSATSKTVWVALEPLAGGSGPKIAVPATTSWTTQTIKLSSLAGSLTKFGKVNVLGDKAGAIFYVDDVKLVAKAAAAAPAAPAVAPAAPAAPAVAVSATFPSKPVTPSYDTVVALGTAANPYSAYVPSSYDASHKTPMSLLVWMHGCGGDGAGDTWTVSPGKRLATTIGAQNWISVSLGGRDGKCWNVSTDSALVLAALADVETHFNIDSKRVVIGGYSSGGDLAYRTAFYNAKLFAGVIAENTSPFRDTGATQANALAAAAWKLPVAHLAHLGDTTYPIARVRAETDALSSAGFPMTRIERAGTHADPDTVSSGTVYDRRNFLLPFVMNAGWTAP